MTTHAPTLSMSRRRRASTIPPPNHARHLLPSTSQSQLRAHAVLSEVSNIGVWTLRDLQDTPDAVEEHEVAMTGDAVPARGSRAAVPPMGALQERPVPSAANNRNQK